MIPEEYLVVEARIKKELQNIKRLENELSEYKLFPLITASSIGGFALTDNAACRIAGSILHDYYSAAENIFKAVAVRIDKTIVTGEQWHKELLEQMTLGISGVRPPLIRSETAGKLDRLRAFRHVFRLAPEKIRELLTDMPELSGLLKKDLAAFEKKMRKLLFDM